MSSKRISDSKDKSEEAGAKKKKYKSGSEKRLETSKKVLAKAGSAPGQQKLWQPRGSASESLMQPTTSSTEAAIQSELVPDTVTSIEVPFDAGEPSTSQTVQQEYTEENSDSEKLSDTDSESSVCDVTYSDLSSTPDLSIAFRAPDPMCHLATKLSFMKQHPVQPLPDATHTLPFQAHKVYFRPVPGGSAIQRKWLSYCTQTQKLFCSTCMAFCTNRRSHFISGWTIDKVHVYARVREHEESVQHQASAAAYLSAEKRTDIETMINVNLANKRKEKIQQNRTVVKRVIDIILCIAKLSLAYRGKDEAAHSLLNPDLNHGNFLEIALLLSKCDSTLKRHIDEVAAISEKRKKRHPESKGRGGLVTFLSKTSVNRLIVIMGNMVKEKISQDVKDAVKFSVEMDSTQDVAVQEQCSIILRYVKDRTVHERLFSLINVSSTTGRELFSVMKEQLEKFSLSVANIIGCSFDGAANMSGCYNGVQAHIKTMSCNSVYTWCYAHILNLVIVDATKCAYQVKTFFGVLEKTAVFFSESYKRSSVWTEQVSSQSQGHDKLARLKKIGDTRWWSKPRALRTIFGSVHDHSKQLYSTLLYCLHYISTSPTFDDKAITEANNLLHCWTRYETLLVAFLFMQIFEIASPVSDYLQTRGLDVLQAWRMIENTRSQILGLRDAFPDLLETVNTFIGKVDSTLEEHSINAVIEKALPQKRIARKKTMPGELAKDEPSSDPLKSFQHRVFYVVIDQATMSIETKFSKNKNLIQDLVYFDPRKFEQMSYTDIPSEALKTVAELAQVDITQLKVELLSFKENYAGLKNPYPPTVEITDEADEEEEEAIEVKKLACENCLTCCYRLLYDYNLHSAAYTNLFAVYKTLLTLACTQVSCERVFSKLKIVKHRLRSLIGQELLESLILLNTERDISRDLDYDDIINSLAMSSSVLKKMLL